MARWITAEEGPAIAPAPPAETPVARVVDIDTRLAEAREQIAALESAPRPAIVPDAPASQTSVKRAELVPAPAKKRKASSTKKPVSPATSAPTGFPAVVPVPGAEAMYAAYCARGKAARRGKKSAMKYQYPSEWEKLSGPKSWTPGPAPVEYGGSYQAPYGPPVPVLTNLPAPMSGPVSVPTGPDARDVAWRKQNAKLDAYLAHLEVAGRILRRYAIDADTQHLELPESPGSLTTGETLEWSAERVAANLEHLAGIRQEVAA